MILKHYYRIEKVENKSKQRMLCTASTRDYPKFETMRAIKTRRETEKRVAINEKDLAMFCSLTPDRFSEHIKKIAGLSLTDTTGHNISSIIIPDMWNWNGNGYGDYKEDALLFMLNDTFLINGTKVEQGSVIEILIAPRRRRDSRRLYEMLNEGELDEEIKVLKKRATETNETGGNNRQ